MCVDNVEAHPSWFPGIWCVSEHGRIHDFLWGHIIFDGSRYMLVAVNIPVNWSMVGQVFRKPEKFC